MSSKQAIYPVGGGLKNPAYTPGIAVGNFLIVSGQGPFNPEKNKFENHDFDHEVKLTLQNVERVLAAAGASLGDVVKVTVHLQNINDVARMNSIYEGFFPHQDRRERPCSRC
jgi:2-iminobutanoate/2-iminopropanoate deaminase